MKPPVVTSWMGPDGITVHGIMCIDDDIISLMNRCQLDDCSICYNPSATHGKHQICCLPCGYGFSCIKKWLLLSSSGGKCPQCNTLCSFQDAILLYPPRLCVTAHQKCPQCNTLCSVEDALLLYPPHLCVTAHQKASSATLFPFTKQGFLEFKKYEYSRMLDAQLLRADNTRHKNILVTKQNDLAYREKELEIQWDNLLTRAEELEERSESLGLADALRRRASPLEPRVKALRRRTDALERLVTALRRLMDALEQREKEAEKVPEKKLKHKEKKDEKVEVKDKPTTKTTECVGVRSRSNSGKGTDSISKVILKQKTIQIKKRIQAACDRQKSYADRIRKPLEFQVRDKVMLKVSPWKGVIHFGKRGKLNPRYIRPFKVLAKGGIVAYRFEIPDQLSRKQEPVRLTEFDFTVQQHELQMALGTTKWQVGSVSSNHSNGEPERLGTTKWQVGSVSSNHSNGDQQDGTPRNDWNGQNVEMSILFSA
ncbi:zinc finger, RING/FYVE/PHD-type containing protein [Tanacetum coccineum]|uniref:Zinc finger, RING/FYVE/PHD-type containing protein n=1 Tax=Tanacetum coccineum TaxID=301880 RepID=A0ABQ5GZ10_9ASTR